MTPQDWDLLFSLTQLAATLMQEEHLGRTEPSPMEASLEIYFPSHYNTGKSCSPCKKSPEWLSVVGWSDADSWRHQDSLPEDAGL